MISHANNTFFKTPVVCNISDDKIEFIRPTMESSIKEIRFTDGKDGWYRTSISAEDVPTGKFLIDEDESNEDRIVIYFEDIIEPRINHT